MHAVYESAFYNESGSAFYNESGSGSSPRFITYHGDVMSLNCLEGVKQGEICDF